MRKRALAVLAIVMLAIAAPQCSLTRDVERFSDGKDADGAAAASGGGASGGWGADAACLPADESCAAYNECCSLTCTNGKCASCKGVELSCVSRDDCCPELDCHAGGCTTCRSEGAACSLASECCSQSCQVGKCGTCSGLNGDCATAPCCPGHECVAGKCQLVEACSAADQAALAQNDVIIVAAYCFNTCKSNMPCALDCMVVGTGASRNCSQCLLATLGCLVSHCASDCDILKQPFDWSSCRTCCNDKCPGFHQCSGMASCPP